MYSLAAIKATATVVSLGLGIGAVAVAVSIQRNPLTFTHAGSETQRIDVPYVPREVPALPPPMAIVTIPEVEISAAPQTFEVKKAVRPFIAPKKVAPAPEVEEKIDPTQDRVIPAPCNDGEYRKLDEQRGVRLMCPGKQ